MGALQGHCEAPVPHNYTHTHISVFFVTNTRLTSRICRATIIPVCTVQSTNRTFTVPYCNVISRYLMKLKKQTHTQNDDDNE